MILVLAGTKDGREIAAELERSGFSVLVSVQSGYGRSLAQETGLTVSAKSLDADGFSSLISDQAIRIIVDASHPYAVNVSKNALCAAERSGVRYVRYERPALPLPAYDKLYLAGDAAEAAQLSAELGRVIFLTTGSRSLAVFKRHPLLAQHRLVARVLPDPAVLAECLALGFLPRDIVAVQGPFSQALNMALFKEFGSEVVITKNSGLVGGSDEKFKAAVELGLNLVVIDRPVLDYKNVVNSGEAVINFVREVENGFYHSAAKN